MGIFLEAEHVFVLAPLHTDHALYLRFAKKILMNCIKNSNATYVETRDEFYASIMAIWSRPLDDSSFEKDMPRLVQRIEIITKDYQQIGPYEGDSLSILKRLVEKIAEELNITLDAEYCNNGIFSA